MVCGPLFCNQVTAANVLLEGAFCILVFWESSSPSGLIDSSQQDIELFTLQAAFNFMSCGAVAMAKMYAGSDAALTMGLIMGAHLVSMDLLS